MVSAVCRLLFTVCCLQCVFVIDVFGCWLFEACCMLVVDVCLSVRLFATLCIVVGACSCHYCCVWCSMLLLSVVW